MMDYGRCLLCCAVSVMSFCPQKTHVTVSTVAILTTETSLWTCLSATQSVMELDCAATYWFHLWPIYWLSLATSIKPFEVQLLTDCLITVLNDTNSYRCQPWRRLKAQCTYVPFASAFSPQCTYHYFGSLMILKGYGPDGRVSIPGRGRRYFSTPQGQDRLWGPPNLLFNRYRGLFPRGYAAGVWRWPLTSI
jgi:hypothetical protein